MQSIIVASDLSDRSDNAMRRGVELAIALGADLRVLHVVDNAMPGDIAEMMQAKAEQHLEEVLAGYVAGRTLTPEVQVEIGDVAAPMSEAARQADLLILGVHRRRAFLDQYRETTMERLIRGSRVPVLMVTGPGDRPYTGMLGAVGLSRNCTAALQKGRLIAPEAKMALFHAHEVSFRKESERDYETWKALSGLPAGMPEPIFIEGKPADAVEDLMKEADYDLMTIGANTRSGMSQALLGGSTAAWIRSPPCDLLVAK